MTESILNAIKQTCFVSEKELELFESKLVCRTFKKGQYLIKPGQVCSMVSFLNKGSFRHFYISGDVESTVNLYVQNDWMLDHHSFLTQGPADTYIQAFEDSEVLQLDVHSIHELIAACHGFFRIATVIELGKKTFSIADQARSPEERYKVLLTRHPEVIRRFPLKYIASYLGITPETLSRIRSRVK